MNGLFIYLAPVVLGHEGRGLFNMPSMQTMSDKKQLQLQQTRQVGDDLRLTFTTKKPS